ncbi:hypothetical protein SESBI_47604, partial [Sesbania bispinosa]
MLVQDRASPTPKSSIPNPKRTTSLPTTNRFAETKNLDFSAWVSDNLYKIVAILLLVVTVAALFFLRNVGDTAALLCFEKQAEDLERIHFPRVDWNSITTIADKTSKYASFRSEKWIVVSVLSYPSDSLKRLVKIKGVAGSGDWKFANAVGLGPK